MTLPSPNLIKPTHTVRAKCELRVRELADYMAASHQRRRSVLRGFKFPKIARTVQHKEARVTITNWLMKGQGDTSTLIKAAEAMRSKMATSDFETDQNDHNADYVDAFVAAFPSMPIPICEMLPVNNKGYINLDGVTVVYNPDIAVARTTVRNTRKIGGIFLRYAKGKELSEEAANFQSAFTYGFLKDTPFEPESEPEKKLCLTIDGYTGNVTEAPGNSTYLWKEMKAVCANISFLWPMIEAPANAVF